MREVSGSMEGLISGIGVAIAAAMLMLIIFTLLGSTGHADKAIMLQSAASEICGDIGTVASYAMPYSHVGTCPDAGISIRITSDYVIASDDAGNEFARPLAVRVYPGSYCSQGRIFWNDTREMREHLNRTFGRAGTQESPLNLTDGGNAAALMREACLDMDSCPLYVDAIEPLTIEKLFLYTYNNTSHATESEPYVFVFRR